ncbi:MAG: DUF72 domain-containing protein [Pseudolysinimonas sp.]
MAKASAELVAGAGSHLERYASLFPCVEINSSFYRSHQRATYERWAKVTPREFRFALKVPRQITHEGGLCAPARPLRQFLDETSGLGVKRGPLLVQLPPSHQFDARVVGRFLAALRQQFAGVVVCEPRHSSWFTAPVDRLLADHEVARVAAHPGVVTASGVPGGWVGFAYVRLHGWPRVYWSKYSPESIRALATTLIGVRARQAWCIFDNTGSGAAFGNAAELQRIVKSTCDKGCSAPCRLWQTP